MSVILPPIPTDRFIRSFDGVILNKDEIRYARLLSNASWQIVFRDGSELTIQANLDTCFGFAKEKEPTEWELRLCKFLGSKEYRYDSKGGPSDWIGYPIGEFMGIQTKGTWNRKMLTARRKIHAEINRLINEGFLVVNGKKIKVRV